MCIVIGMFSSWQLADIQAREVVLSNIFIASLTVGLIVLGFSDQEGPPLQLQGLLYRTDWPWLSVCLHVSRWTFVLLSCGCHGRYEHFYECFCGRKRKCLLNAVITKLNCEHVCIMKIKNWRSTYSSVLIINIMFMTFHDRAYRLCK
jgi:hypothetical protein